MKNSNQLQLSKLLPDMEEPAPKVLQMYDAVIELLMEKREASSIKVSDITAKAGIGKGTAYEYFSSKEEIIMKAVVYGCQSRLVALENDTDTLKEFKEKIFCIFDWIKENCRYYMMISQLLQLGPGRECHCDNIESKVPGLSIHALKAYAFAGIDSLMAEGQTQGIYTETDPVKCRLAFLSVIMSYLATIMSSPHGGDYFTMPDADAQEFCYAMFAQILKF